MVSAGIFQISQEEHEKNPKTKHDYEGIVPKRWTTDILFLILIWLMWGAMSYVGYTGIIRGDPYRLIGGIDSDGKTCGFGNTYESNKLLYAVTSNGLGTCVSSCPSIDAPLTSTDPNDFVCLNQIDSSAIPAQITLCQNGGASYTVGVTGCYCNIKRATSNYLRRCIFDSADVRALYSGQHGKISY
jgi:hypothetical protein